MQVERQATAEHLHWIREQRRQVYSDVLASHAAFQTATIIWLVEVKQDRSLPSEDHLRFQGQYVELAEVTARADLWGPTTVVDEAHALRRAAGGKFSALSGWSHAIRAEQTSDIPSFSQQYEAAAEAFNETRSDFIQAAVNASQF